MLWVVMATVGLVMLIACTNVANLLLVRADSRQQELSIRAALGAGRARIARELLVESVTLGLIGGVLALGVAYAGLRLLIAFGPANLPRLSEISLDARSLAFTFALSVISGFLFGSIPAFKYARTRAAAALSGSARTASAGRDRQRSRNVLVVAQVAMALVLLVSALLMIRTFAALRNVEPGFTDPEHLADHAHLHSRVARRRSRLVTRIENDIADKICCDSGCDLGWFLPPAYPWKASIPIGMSSRRRKELRRQRASATPLQLRLARIFLTPWARDCVAGRDFTWSDIYSLQQYIIVSENFARENVGLGSSSHRQACPRNSQTCPGSEVIGVVEDVRHNGVDEKAPAIVYWPAMINSPYTRKPTIDSQRTVTFAVRSNRAGTKLSSPRSSRPSGR